MHTPPMEPIYVISLEEIFWGGILVAITMAIHGFGMLMVLRINRSVKLKLENKKSLMSGLIPLIFASCLIMFLCISRKSWSGQLFFYGKERFRTPAPPFILP